MDDETKYNGMGGHDDDDDDDDGGPDSHNNLQLDSPCFNPHLPISFWRSWDLMGSMVKQYLF